MVGVWILVGGWFVCMGTWAMTHAERDPETPAGHWLSTPDGRRIGGALSVVVGLAAMIGSVAVFS